MVASTARPGLVFIQTRFYRKKIRCISYPNNPKQRSPTAGRNTERTAGNGTKEFTSTSGGYEAGKEKVNETAVKLFAYIVALIILLTFMACLWWWVA